MIAAGAILARAAGAAFANNLELVVAARQQVGVTVIYDGSYRVLAYPGGDVPIERGVCTDVIVRALRDARGVDLQKLVHEDMRAHFRDYPQRWGLARPDANIDHRRVPNLMKYFERAGYRRPSTARPRTIYRATWWPGTSAAGCRTSASSATARPAAACRWSSTTSVPGRGKRTCCSATPSSATTGCPARHLICRRTLTPCRGAFHGRLRTKMSAKPGLAKPTEVPADPPNSARRFFGVFRYSKRALELVWATSPKLSVFLGFVTLVAGVLPSVVAWVGARIVDSVVAAGRDYAAAGTADLRWSSPGYSSRR